MMMDEMEWAYNRILLPECVRSQSVCIVAHVVQQLTVFLWRGSASEASKRRKRQATRKKKKQASKRKKRPNQARNNKKEK